METSASRDHRQADSYVCGRRNANRDLASHRQRAGGGAIGERLQANNRRRIWKRFLQGCKPPSTNLRKQTDLRAADTGMAAEQAAYQSLLKLRAREHEVVRQQQQQQHRQQSSQQSNSRSQEQREQLQQLDLRETGESLRDRTASTTARGNGAGAREPSSCSIACANWRSGNTI